MLLTSVDLTGSPKVIVLFLFAKFICHESTYYRISFYEEIEHEILRNMIYRIYFSFFRIKHNRTVRSSTACKIFSSVIVFTERFIPLINVSFVISVSKYNALHYFLNNSRMQLACELRFLPVDREFPGHISL